MRNVLALIGLLVIGVGGLGWYLGWYKIQSTPTPDGHRQIQIDLNTNKITEDVNKGKVVVRDYLNTDTPNTNPQNPAPNPANTQPTSKPVIPGSTTSFRPNDDGSIVFPGFAPTPPNGGPTLPTPR